MVVSFHGIQLSFSSLVLLTHPHHLTAENCFKHASRSKTPTFMRSLIWSHFRIFEGRLVFSDVGLFFSCRERLSARAPVSKAAPQFDRRPAGAALEEAAGASPTPQPGGTASGPAVRLCRCVCSHFCACVFSRMAKLRLNPVTPRRSDTESLRKKVIQFYFPYSTAGEKGFSV